MARTITLRLFGLAVAAVFATAAIALLAFGLGAEPGALRSWLADVSAWLTNPFQEGSQVLVGVGILLIAVLALLISLRRPRAKVKRFTKNSEGITSIDMESVASVAERRLRKEVDAGVRVTADGTRRITAVVPVYSAQDSLVSVDEVGVALPAILDELGVPTANRVITGTTTKRRVR